MEQNNLLLHSLSEYRELIFECLETAKVTTVAEVGVGEGDFTSQLCGWVHEKGGTHFCVDPFPPQALTELVAQSPWMELRKGKSSDMLQLLPVCAAYILDGDHNYYTLSLELSTIQAKCSEENTHPLVFVHDVAGPWARRDAYFDPESLPADACHPYAPARELLIAADIEFGKEVRQHLMGSANAAMHEGGAKNGILTAVEDFINKGNSHFIFKIIPNVFGLGVLFDKRSIYACKLEQILNPLSNSPLLTRLEKNRIALYQAYMTWRLESLRLSAKR